MHKLIFNKEKVRSFLSEVLPGHELEAYEAITCAFHHLDFQFSYAGALAKLHYNEKTKNFTVSY